MAPILAALRRREGRRNTQKLRLQKHVVSLGSLFLLSFSTSIPVPFLLSKREANPGSGVPTRNIAVAVLNSAAPRTANR